MTERPSYDPSGMRLNQRVWRTVLVWLPVVAWMVLIFLFSAQPADESAAISGGLLGWLVDQLTRLMPDLSLDLDYFHHFIRKTAHFAVYAVLGMLTLTAVRQSRPLNTARPLRVSWPPGRIELLLAWLISIVYAVTDELHQITVPGRSGEFRDVVLDSCGALSGILLMVLLLYWRWRHRQRRQQKRKAASAGR